MTLDAARKSMIHEAFDYGDAEHAHYEKHGYTIFEHFLTDEALHECRQDLDRMLSRLHATCTPEEMICAHQLGERWIWDLGTEPKLLNMIERQIGPNIVFWSSHALAKPPRTGIEVRWHQDAPYWNVVGRMPGAVWIPLDDVDEENGTMSILPDWHTKGQLPRLIVEDGDKPLFREEIDPKDLPDDADQRKVTYRLEAGQMATHHTMLPHCSTPNRSDRWRRIISMRYVAADAQLGEKVYKDFRTLEPFDRAFFLVRGEDIKGYGLKRSPFD